jgi:hypothetical protein
MNTTASRTLAALALAAAALTLSGTAHAADLNPPCSGESCTLCTGADVTTAVDFDANQDSSAETGALIPRLRRPRQAISAGAAVVR